MKIPRIHSPDRHPRGGFTLVELLAVMGIMALLLAVTIPSIQGLNMSAGLSQGGQLFSDEVSLARQTASARNVTVEVRCIKVPSRATDGYTAMQLWSTATVAPLSRMVTMPDGIVISQDTTTVSTLFATFPLNGTMPSDGPMADDTYVAFTVSPSGMVGPFTTTGTTPTMTATSVGVVSAAHATDTALPSNYSLVQLNPLTAATVIYRP